MIATSNARRCVYCQLINAVMVWSGPSQIQSADHLHASKAPRINIPINRQVNWINWMLFLALCPCQCVRCTEETLTRITYKCKIMTWPNGNIFLVTSLLCGEFNGHCSISLTKASDAELSCFLCSVPYINVWVENREPGNLRRYRLIMTSL